MQLHSPGLIEVDGSIGGSCWIWNLHPMFSHEPRPRESCTDKQTKHDGEKCLAT